MFVLFNLLLLADGFCVKGTGKINVNRPVRSRKLLAVRGGSRKKQKENAANVEKDLIKTKWWRDRRALAESPDKMTRNEYFRLGVITLLCIGEGVPLFGTVYVERSDTSAKSMKT